MSLRIVVGGMLWAIITIFLSLNVLAKDSSQNNYKNVLTQKDLRAVVSQGTALINNGDQSSARNDAINDALTKAVEQIAGMLISSETVTSAYDLLNNNVYKHATDYVHDYKVLSEGVNNNVYNVTLQVTIGMKHLKKELDNLNLANSTKEEPTVAVIILEQNIGERRLESALFYAPLSPFDNYIIPEVHLLNEVGSMSIAENEVIRKLIANGVDVEDEAVLMKDIKLSPGYKLQSLDDKTVREIGKLANIDIIIYGKAVAKLYGRIAGSEMKSAQADISLRAVDVKNGRILASGQQHAASVHIDALTAGNEALKKATDELADSIIPTMLSQWRQNVSSLQKMKVLIVGVNSPEELTGLKDQFITTDGVKNVHDKSIGNREATLEIEYNGNEQHLIGVLLANKDITSAYNITTTTSDNTITLTRK